MLKGKYLIEKKFKRISAYKMFRHTDLNYNTIRAVKYGKDVRLSNFIKVLDQLGLELEIKEKEVK